MLWFWHQRQGFETSSFGFAEQKVNYMANEWRFIIFNEAEVIRGLVDVAPRINKTLPLGSAVSVKYKVTNQPNNLGPQVSAYLMMRPNEGAGETPIKFTTTETMTAMILYCKNNQIPLPRDSTKGLELVRNMLSLRVGMWPKKQADKDNWEKDQDLA